MKPEITRRGIIDMQVCVPSEWSDYQVVQFAEKQNPCGTTGVWCIRRHGNAALDGQPERNPCAQRSGFIHVVLDA